MLYDGVIHYISSDDAQTLHIPRINVRYYLHGDDEIDWLSQPVRSYPNFLNTLPEDTVVKNIHEAHFWSSTDDFNWQHYVGEFIPTLHYTLCKYLGRCSYDPKDRRLHIFELFPPSLPNEYKIAQFASDAVACFTHRPLKHVKSSALRGRAVVIQRALIGVGPECRGSWWCHGDPQWGGGRTRVPSEYLSSYRKRMGECLGFDADKKAAMDPALKILLINRKYTSARSILNLHQVEESLERRYSSIATVTVEYMEGKTLREQAQLWNSASIIIHVHGATMGSWPFAPHNGVVVHISPRPHGVLHDTMYANELVNDFNAVNNMTYVSVENNDDAYAHLRSEHVWKDVEWQQLSADDKMKIMETGSCDHIQDNAIKNRCSMWWIHKQTDLVVQPDMLLVGVDKAVAQIFEKFGRSVPPGVIDLPVEEEQLGRKRRRQRRRRFVFLK